MNKLKVTLILTAFVSAGAAQADFDGKWKTECLPTSSKSMPEVKTIVVTMEFKPSSPSTGKFEKQMLVFKDDACKVPALEGKSVLTTTGSYAIGKADGDGLFVYSEFLDSDDPDDIRISYQASKFVNNSHMKVGDGTPDISKIAKALPYDIYRVEEKP